MFPKGIVFLTLVAFSATQYAEVEEQQNLAAVVPEDKLPSSYEFHYEVLNQDNGDLKSQTELSNGYEVQGEYVVAQPDGCVRTVRYTADGSGFVPQITYEGSCDPARYKAPQPGESTETSKPNVQSTQSIPETRDYWTYEEVPETEQNHLPALTVPEVPEEEPLENNGAETEYETAAPAIQSTEQFPEQGTLPAYEGVVPEFGAPEDVSAAPVLTPQIAELDYEAPTFSPTYSASPTISGLTSQVPASAFAPGSTFTDTFVAPFETYGPASTPQIATEKEEASQMYESASAVDSTPSLIPTSSGELGESFYASIHRPIPPASTIPSPTHASAPTLAPAPTFASTSGFAETIYGSLQRPVSNHEAVAPTPRPIYEVPAVQVSSQPISAPGQAPAFNHVPYSVPVYAQKEEAPAALAKLSTTSGAPNAFYSSVFGPGPKSNAAGPVKPITVTYAPAKISWIPPTPTNRMPGVPSFSSSSQSGMSMSGTGMMGNMPMPAMYTGIGKGPNGLVLGPMPIGKLGNVHQKSATNILNANAALNAGSRNPYTTFQTLQSVGAYPDRR